MQGAADSGLTAKAALEWTSQQRPRVQAIAPHWIDELEGLAQGAGIRSDEALALQLRPGTGGLPEGCTSFAAVGDATTNRHTIAGQNRDLGEPYLHRMFIAVLRPTQGPAILMHCVPGEIGGVGLNSHGVALFANSLWGRSGRTWMAPPILRRAALEAATAEAAVQRIQALPGPAVGNFLIADTHHARNLEILAEGVHVTEIDHGVYAHANNCTVRALLPHEAQRRPLPHSEGRRHSLQSPSIATPAQSIPMSAAHSSATKPADPNPSAAAPVPATRSPPSPPSSPNPTPAPSTSATAPQPTTTSPPTASNRVPSVIPRLSPRPLRLPPVFRANPSSGSPSRSSREPQPGVFSRADRRSQHHPIHPTHPDRHPLLIPPPLSFSLSALTSSLSPVIPASLLGAPCHLSPRHPSDSPATPSDP